MAAIPPIRTKFFYGWIVVAVAFVSMGIAVNTRTAFSLLYPPILDEFGWERGATAGAFSLGFLASTAAVPVVGMMIDRYGPRLVLPLAAFVMAAGLIGVTFVTTPLQFSLTLGLLTVGGSMPLTYIGHSMFLPNWFVRRRGLAIGLAFSGVGVGSILMLPLLQAVIEAGGWRAACRIMAVLCAALIPLNFLLQRKSPEGLGLLPDGEGRGPARAPMPSTVVDEAWVERDWTLGHAMRTPRFWWISAGFFCALYAWYTVQVHQTRYLADVGFGAGEAAFALGLVGLCGVAGQIWIGHFSDRIGREWAWTIGMSGFIVTALALLALDHNKSRLLMYLMVASQGLMGYGVASVFGAMPAEIFAGRRFATIFGMLSVFGNIGAGVGPWLTGDLYDRTGSYRSAFILLIVLSAVSIACIWMAAPRKVRLVAGQAARRAATAPGGA
ncbi:MAG: MFS transporter [Rhizobiales bacterium 65-79]|jgi:MFS family permease|nr:MFS transporter [Hyphomicrobiales bacterium]OJU06706.1 MAG: MFS transporter [Rhizobiales bacterium 65-79]